MPDAVESVLPYLLADGNGFHVAEWLRDDCDLHEARWIPTGDVGWLRWLLHSNLAKRCDLRLSAVPYLDAGSYRVHALGACLWVRTESGDSARRLARFRPEPTLLTREGQTNRMVAFWALERGLPAADIERANRRLSYALHTKAGDCEPGFRFHPPGVILRHGRSRPVVVCAETVEPVLYPVSLTRRLKDRPKPDPSKWSNRPSPVAA